MVRGEEILQYGVNCFTSSFPYSFLGTLIARKCVTSVKQKKNRSYSVLLVLSGYLSWIGSEENGQHQQYSRVLRVLQTIKSHIWR